MKMWEKPKLIILVRGKPEEAILVFCKSAALSGASPGTFDFECDVANGCEGCESINDS
jgi:hypothetical protein